MKIFYKQLPARCAKITVKGGVCMKKEHKTVAYDETLQIEAYRRRPAALAEGRIKL